MNGFIVERGIIATTPRHIVTSDGVSFTTFRLATSRKGADGKIVGNNWYTIYCEGQLSINVYESVSKGNRIIVTGIVNVKDWETDSGYGSTVEIVADSIGHDFNYGVATFSRRYIKEDN